MTLARKFQRTWQLERWLQDTSLVLKEFSLLTPMSWNRDSISVRLEENQGEGVLSGSIPDLKIFLEIFANFYFLNYLDNIRSFDLSF